MKSQIGRLKGHNKLCVLGGVGEVKKELSTNRTYGFLFSGGRLEGGCN